jgi:hypothetical protein
MHTTLTSSTLDIPRQRLTLSSVGALSTLHIPRQRLTLFSVGALAPLLLLLASCGGGDGPIDGDRKCESNLLLGDLVITEVMANPEGDDDGNEYFEIYNATSNVIDLAGVVLEKAGVDGSKAKQHIMSSTILQPGTYMALGGVLPEFRAPYIGYGYAADLGSMTNSGGQLALYCQDTEIDRVFYGEATSGHSQGLDGVLTPDHIANDDLANFCDATTEFATGAFGSPGVANEPCSIVEQTTCMDNGTERDVVQPTVGQLVITEFMANPSIADDAVGEWFEVMATADFDLNGLVAGTDPNDPKVNLVNENCLSVTSGDHIVFARSEDSAANGGLPGVDHTFSFGLVNGGSSLFVGVGDTVIDQITWTGSSAGASTALDADQLNATANDDEANWCDGKSSYGDGDLGSPGQTNPLCDSSGMCMDGPTMRATVPPLAADVTITEFMPNPDVVTDANGEWFEVHFAADADLNGLQLGKDIGPPLNPTVTLSDANCLSVAADTYVVFARNIDPLENGGLPQTNIFLANIPLTNGGDSIFVAIADTLLDSVTYNASTAGASTQIDSVGATCNGTDVYGEVANNNLGTPGAANNTCP